MLDYEEELLAERDVMQDDGSYYDDLDGLSGYDEFDDLDDDECSDAQEL